LKKRGEVSNLANDSESYEIIIIGGGPAGLTAGIYTARDRLRSLLIEKGLVGGQLVNAERLENYPGFPEGISGFELTETMHRQATKHGLETVIAEVTGIKLEQGRKVVETTEGNFSAEVVIIGGGSRRQQLGIPGETEFTGKGVSYCATCDGAFFRDLPVAVAGGGNSAITEALHLAKSASKVTVIHRRHELRAAPLLQEKAFSEPKIEFLWDTVVRGIEGDDFVSQLKLHQVKTGEESTLAVSGIFISVGLSPNTDYLKGVLPLDDTRHIITNTRMETGVADIFAAGDIRQDAARQAITAAGDGATAAIYAGRFLTSSK
jgi:thioredoxin reductase (NADPH)